MSWVTAGAPWRAAAARPTTRNSTPSSTRASRNRASLSVRRGGAATSQAPLQALQRAELEKPERVPDVLEGRLWMACMDAPRLAQESVRAVVLGRRLVLEHLGRRYAQHVSEG